MLLTVPEVGEEVGLVHLLEVVLVHLLEVVLVQKVWINLSKCGLLLQRDVVLVVLEKVDGDVVLSSG